MFLAYFCAWLSKISNQRDNYSQTRRHLDPDLNFVVGLASPLAETQTSITKHPKVWYCWEHVWETLLLRTHNSTVVSASISTALAANLNEAQWCRSPFLPLFKVIFLSPLWNIFSDNANWKPSKLECLLSLRLCKGEKFYWKHSFPFF